MLTFRPDLWATRDLPWTSPGVPRYLYLHNWGHLVEITGSFPLLSLFA